MENKKFTVSYRCGDNRETVQGEVVAADREVGITIVNRETREYLYCTNGPLSPLTKMNHHWFATPDNLAEYYAKYDYVIAGIESGELDLDEYDVVFKFSAGSTPGAGSCAFA